MCVCVCSLLELVQDQHDYYYEVFSVVLFLLLLFFCFSWFFSPLPLSVFRSSLLLSRVPLSGEFLFLFLVLFYFRVFIVARASYLKQLKWRPQAAVCRMRYDDIKIYMEYIYDIFIGYMESEHFGTAVNQLPKWIYPRKRHDGNSCMQPNLIRGNLRRVAPPLSRTLPPQVLQLMLSHF